MTLDLLTKPQGARVETKTRRRPRLLRWAVRTIVALTGLVVLTGLSVLLFPGFWLGIAADIMLGDERIGKPPTDPAAAISAEIKISTLRNILHNGIEAVPPPDIVFSELEINSYIEMRIKDAQNDEWSEYPRNLSSREEALHSTAEALENLQVALADRSLTVAGNVNLKQVASLIKARTGQELPEEFQRTVVFRAAFSVSTTDDVLRIESESLIIGRTFLHKSAPVRAMGVVSEKIETWLRQKIAAQMPQGFQQISADETSFRLPENVGDISVSPGGIRLKFQNAKLEGTNP